VRHEAEDGENDEASEDARAAVNERHQYRIPATTHPPSW